MNWTKGLPKTPGLYWFRGRSAETEGLIRVGAPAGCESYLPGMSKVLKDTQWRLFAEDNSPTPYVLECLTPP